MCNATIMSVANETIMLTVPMLNVTILIVVAPLKIKFGHLCKYFLLFLIEIMFYETLNRMRLQNRTVLSERVN